MGKVLAYGFVTGIVIYFIIFALGHLGFDSMDEAISYLAPRAILSGLLGGFIGYILHKT